MAFFGALTWMQTRFGVMSYPRMTKVLFWGLHLSLLVASSYSSILMHFFAYPRRYSDYAGIVEMISRVSNWALLLAGAAGLGLIGALVWSIVARRRSA